MEAGVSTILLPNGKRYRLSDEGDYPLYSVADLQSGSTDPEVILFGYIEGDDVARTQDTVATPPREATRRDTNVETAGQMGEDEAMSIYSMRIFITEAQVPDTGDEDETFGGFQPSPDVRNLMRFTRWCVVSLKIMGEKDFELHEPLFFVPGYGPFVAISGTGAAVVNAANAGFPGHGHARRAVIPHLVPPTETLKVVIENPDAKTLNWIGPDGDDPDPDTQLRTRVTLLGPRMKAVGVDSPAYPSPMTGEGSSQGVTVVQ